MPHSGNVSTGTRDRRLIPSHGRRNQTGKTPLKNVAAETRLTFYFNYKLSVEQPRDFASGGDG